jgi:phage terminase small subunit
MKSLTGKQMRFCAYFVETGNASKAYRRVYNCARSKPTTIRRSAHELLQNPNVTAMVEQLQKEEQDRIKRKYQVNNDRAMREYVRTAFSDIRKLFDRSGNLLPIDQIDPDTARAIASIEVVENTRGRGEGTFVYYTYRIKMADKLAALRDVAKMLGMFNKDITPDNKQPVTVNNQINVPEVLGRLYPAPAALPGERDKDK